LRGSELAGGKKSRERFSRGLNHFNPRDAQNNLGSSRVGQFFKSPGTSDHVKMMRRSKAPKSSIERYCVLAMVWAFTVSAAFAQQSSDEAAGLRVIVSDTQQRTVAGAVCSLRSESDNAGVVATAMTDEKGVAKFSAMLRAGNYALFVESPGFETFNRHNVIVKEGEGTEVSISLLIAAVTEKVTVVAPSDEATNVRAGSSTAAGILQRQTLQRLPLAVRNQAGGEEHHFAWLQSAW
jgi:hypothetical protein